MAATAVLHVGPCRVVALVLLAVAGLAVPTVRRTVVRVSVLNFAKQRRSEERQQERRKAEDAAAASAAVIVDGGPPVAAPHHGRHQAVNGKGQAEGGRVSQGLVGTDDDALAIWRSADRLEHGRHHPGDGVGNTSGRHGTTRHQSTTVFGEGCHLWNPCALLCRYHYTYKPVISCGDISLLTDGFRHLAVIYGGTSQSTTSEEFCRDLNTST